MVAAQKGGTRGDERGIISAARGPGRGKIHIALFGHIKAMTARAVAKQGITLPCYIAAANRAAHVISPPHKILRETFLSF
jgi:hypothetical protein